MDLSEQAYVKIYFLDNSYKTLLVPKSEKVQDFTIRVAEKLGFESPAEDGYWFGLWESKTGQSLDRPLSKEEQPAKIVAGWTPDAPSKLVFTIKLFLESLIRSGDEIVQHYR